MAPHKHWMHEYLCISHLIHASHIVSLDAKPIDDFLKLTYQQRNNEHTKEKKREKRRIKAATAAVNTHSYTVESYIRSLILRQHLIAHSEYNTQHQQQYQQQERNIYVAFVINLIVSFALRAQLLRVAGTQSKAITNVRACLVH